MTNEEPTTIAPRDAIRSKILSSANMHGATRLITFFGSEIELHQPSVGDIQKLGADAKLGFTQVLIDYAFVPNTKEKVFVAGDLEALNELPFNMDIQKVINVIEEFTNLSVTDAEKN